MTETNGLLSGADIKCIIPDDISVLTQNPPRPVSSLEALEIRLAEVERKLEYLIQFQEGLTQTFW